MADSVEAPKREWTEVEWNRMRERGAEAIDTLRWWNREVATNREVAEAVMLAVFPVGEPDDERVERVAQSLREQAVHEPVPWDGLAEGHRELWRDKARAAVAAVRAVQEKPDG